jgi:hypothetical protein
MKVSRGTLQLTRRDRLFYKTCTDVGVIVSVRLLMAVVGHNLSSLLIPNESEQGRRWLDWGILVAFEFWNCR